MNRLLFDMRKCAKGEYNGGNEYIYAIFLKMVELFGDKCDISVVKQESKELEDFIQELIETKGIRIFNIYKKSEIGKICEQEKIKTFFSGLPYEYEKGDLCAKTNNIGTFHGMRSIECPEDIYEYKYHNRVSKLKKIKLFIKPQIYYERSAESTRQKELTKMRDAIESFQRVITDSETSKYAICRFFPEEINADAIKVFYPAKRKGNEMIGIRDDGFILLSMADRWRKNVYRALKAIANLKEKGMLSKTEIIITGNASAQIKKEFEKYNFNYRGYVSSEQLEELYARCRLYVFPSLNEGFGYTPIEAMKYGKTCVCSCMTSIPEICGNEVYYVNPYDIGELETRILHAYNCLKEPEAVRANYLAIQKRMEDDLVKLCNYICNA